MNLYGIEDLKEAAEALGFTVTLTGPADALSARQWLNLYKVQGTARPVAIFGPESLDAARQFLDGYAHAYGWTFPDLLEVLSTRDKGTPAAGLLDLPKLRALRAVEADTIAGAVDALAQVTKDERNKQRADFPQGSTRETRLSLMVDALEMAAALGNLPLEG